jgi:hypothetical protein
MTNKPKGPHSRTGVSNRRAEAERRVVTAALAWWRDAETIEAYEALKGTESASAPGAFLMLYEAVEDLQRMRLKS